MIPNRTYFFLKLVCLLFFCNIIMTGEPTHTASKERMVPELMLLSERMPQLSNTASKVQWPLRFTYSYVHPVTQCYRQKNSRRSTSATIQSTQKYDDLHAPNYQLLPRKCSGHNASLSAIFSPLHSVTNEEQC